MSAIIVPFPPCRRSNFVTKQANRAAELHPDAGERHIQQQLKIQADAMRRKGVDEDLIAKELRCLEVAIRAALWNVVMEYPGGAK